MSCTCGGVYPKEVGTCARCGRTDVPIANGSDQLFPHLRRIPEGKAFHAYLCKCREQRQQVVEQPVVPIQASVLATGLGIPAMVVAQDLQDLGFEARS